MLFLRITFVVLFLLVFALVLLWYRKLIKDTIEGESSYLSETKNENTLEKWCKLSYEEVNLLCSYVPLKEEEYEHSIKIIKLKMGDLAKKVTFTSEEWRKVIMTKKIGYAKTFFWVSEIYNQMNGETSSDTE